MILHIVLTLCGLFLSTANGQNRRACVTPNGENAQCVSIYSCGILSRLVTTRQPQDVRFLRESQCGYSNGGPLVCCGTVAGYRPIAQSTRRPPRPSGSLVPNPLLPDRSYCGFQETDRIVGGTKTDLREFPWLAMLQYRKISGGYTFSCGGSLINNRYVLTAAHCVTGEIEQKVGTLVGVRLGEYDTSSDIDCIPIGSNDCNPEPTDIEVEQAIAHPDYNDNSPSKYHDIALVRLAYTVPTSAQIRAICLPTSPSERSNSGDIVVASGWGRTENHNFSPTKLKVELPVISNSECASVFQVVQVNVADTQMCAGGEQGQDSCNGDSGAPLMRVASNDTAQWIAEGIVSFGTKCGTRYWPGIYTRVSEYLPWIYNNINP